MQSSALKSPHKEPARRGSVRSPRVMRVKPTGPGVSNGARMERIGAFEQPGAPDRTPSAGGRGPRRSMWSASPRNGRRAGSARSGHEARPQQPDGSTDRGVQKDGKDLGKFPPRTEAVGQTWPILTLRVSSSHYCGVTPLTFNRAGRTRNQDPSMAAFPHHAAHAGPRASEDLDPYVVQEPFQSTGGHASAPPPQSLPRIPTLVVVREACLDRGYVS